MTQVEAQELVDAHPPVFVRFRMEGARYPLFGLVGGIFAYLQDGRVVRAD
jgi:hypothetical protein